jgi:hypothetical protein
MVKVPHFVELSASRVYKMAMAIHTIAAYLPDHDFERPINRTYLYNVSAQVVSDPPIIDHQHRRSALLRS